VVKWLLKRRRTPLPTLEPPLRHPPLERLALPGDSPPRCEADSVRVGGTTGVDEHFEVDGHARCRRGGHGLGERRDRWPDEASVGGSELEDFCAAAVADEIGAAWVDPAAESAGNDAGEIVGGGSATALDGGAELSFPGGRDEGHVDLDLGSGGSLGDPVDQL